MVELVKQSMADIWASAGDIVMPDPSKIATGWAVEIVPRQYWNWMQNRVDNNIAYLLQHGLPEWDATTEYIANKSYVQHNDVVYKAILTGTNQTPSSAPTYWKIAFATSTAALEALKAVTPAADRLPYFNSATTATHTTLTSFARTILDDVDAATVRTTIGAQPLDATLTAVAGLTTGANKLPYFSGVDTATTTDLSAFGRSLIDDADATTARTTLGLASGATTTVGTLATQNAAAVAITGGSIAGITDLAVADGGTGASTAANARTNLGLGNVDNTSDANKPVSAAQQTALNLKAPLASPPLTGTPTAPTPAQFDNDTSLATTEFVQRALGNFSGWSTFTTSGEAIPAAAVGKVIHVQMGADGFVYLPLAAQCVDGAAFTIINTSNTAKCSLSTQAPDVLSLPNITLLPGESVEVIASPFVNSWFVNAGGGALGKTAGFAASLAASGYQKLPSGLIIQWGKVITNGSGVGAVTFPVTFPNATLEVVCSLQSASLLSTIVSSFGNASFPSGTTIYSATSAGAAVAATTVNWIAIGW